MKTLYVVRHAESEANDRNILASRMDYPLSAAGRRQARMVAEGLAAEHRPDLIATSPLTRARETADIFASVLDRLVEVREEITEVHLGRYSGMSYEEVEKADGYVHDREARWDWIPEGGGESYAMIAERVLPFFQWLDHRREERILVVSHAVTMRLIRAHLEGTLPKYPREIAKNGEVWMIAYNGLGSEHVVASLVYENEMPEHRA